MNCSQQTYLQWLHAERYNNRSSRLCLCNSLERRYMPARDLLCGDSALSTLDRLPTCARLRAHRQHQRHGVIALRGSLLVSPRRHRQKHHPSHKLLHRAKTPPPQVPIYTPDLSPRGSSGTLTCLKRKYATMMTVEPRKDKEAQACATRMIACCFAYGIPAVSVSRSPMLSSPVQPCSLNLRPSLLFI